jgi:hypothetical protein
VVASDTARRNRVSGTIDPRRCHIIIEQLHGANGRLIPLRCQTSPLTLRALDGPNHGQNDQRNREAHGQPRKRPAAAEAKGARRA